MLPSQSPLKTVVVAGGGIGGLTFAALARRHGMRCIVIERSPDVCRANLGGGIGLWINSLAVLKLIPHALHALEAVGHYMPSPAYRDDQGRVLAQPTSAFSQHFPVLCLERDSLLKALFEACTRADELASPPVQFHTGVSVESYAMAASQDGGGQEAAVVVTLSDGTAVTGDVLVGADGIHSAVRAQLMQDLGLPEVHVEHCGYVYLRANVKVPADEPQWHAHSFEAWGGDSGVRFGYVPLKPPSVFWFAAVPSQGAGEFAPRKGVQAITEQIKAQLAGWISYWASAPIDIPRLVEMTPSGSILKTDIFKVAQTSRFPWSSPDGRVLLLGDAAHATAPNLAQGAGISIEDAADLVFELQRARATWSAGGLAHAAGNYERARKSRAATVQTLADAVALAGQVQYGWLRFLRNGFMRLTHLAMAPIQSRVFERVVALSLGQGLARESPWVPPALEPRASLLGRVLPVSEFDGLPEHVRAFKACPAGGTGSGMVTVERGRSLLAKLAASLAGLPSNMSRSRFVATVAVRERGRAQRWTRTFGFASRAQTEYSTTHSVVRHRGEELLAEGVGGVLDAVCKFGYRVSALPGGAGLEFVSQGLWVCGARLPLPAWLMLRSAWREVPTEDGWTFRGEISAPIVGRLMLYHGSFRIARSLPAGSAGRAVVAGGSGLLGFRICERLFRDGFEVVVLSRDPARVTDPRFHACKWDARSGDGWWRLLDGSTVVINLAGENPGSKRWSAANKRVILESRLQSIGAVHDALARARFNRTPARAYVQASAAGIYGDQGAAECGETGALGPPGEFRVLTCMAIEDGARRAAQASPGTALALLRIGHVLSNEGGLLPYLELASLCRASRLGSGGQYVPWVHIHDVASAVARVCAQHDFLAGVVNVAAPEPCTNAQLLRALAKSRGRNLCVVPVPSPALHLALGESACVVLDSQRVVPARLLDAGFAFEFGDLSEALLTLPLKLW